MKKALLRTTAVIILLVILLNTIAHESKPYFSWIGKGEIVKDNLVIKSAGVAPAALVKQRAQAKFFGGKTIRNPKRGFLPSFSTHVVNNTISGVITTSNVASATDAPIHTFQVPAGVHEILVKAVGGAGGSVGPYYQGGRGASITRTYVVTPGETLYMIIGQKGGDASDGNSIGGGGGGGTFVYRLVLGVPELLIAAGGGGGAGSDGSYGQGDTQIDANIGTTVISNEFYHINKGYYGLADPNGGDGNGVPGEAGNGGGNGYSMFGANAGGGAGWNPTPTEELELPIYTGDAHGKSPRDANGALGGTSGGEGSGGYGGGGATVNAGGGGGGGYSGGGSGALNTDNFITGTHGGGGGSYVGSGTAIPVFPDTYGSVAADGYVLIDWDNVEINVKGDDYQQNGTSYINIPDGHTNPSIADGTDFGSSLVNGDLIERKFWLENIPEVGPEATGYYSHLLTNTGVTISGPDAGSFIVMKHPTHIMGNGVADYFTIVFAPSASPGIKTATVTIVNNDIDENPYTFTIRAEVIATASPLDPGSIGESHEICSGATANTLSSVTLASGGTGEISYQWLSSTETTGYVNITGATNADYSPGVLTQTTHFIRFAHTTTPEDGIKYTSPVTVTVNPKPVISVDKTDVNCYNGTTGAIDLTVTSGTAPFTYSWSNGAVTEDISGLAAGDYSVTVTDSKQCTAATVVAIVQPANALTASTTPVAASCDAVSDGKISVSASGGTPDYTYSKDGINFQPSNEFTGLASGSYSIIVKDPKGCTIAVPTTVSAGTSPTITGTPNVCVNGTTGLSTTAPTAPNGAWSSADPSVATVVNGLVTGVYAGTTVITVTGTNGCSSSLTVTVAGLPDAPTVSENLSICSGSAITISAFSSLSPQTFTWYTDASGGTEIFTGDGFTTPALTNTTTYYVEVSNGDCVSPRTAATVTVNNTPTPTISRSGPLTFCDGGSVILTSSAATGNVWSTGATTQSITVTTSGNYSVTVTQNDCPAISAVMAVTVNPVPAAPVVTVVDNCDGTSVLSTNAPGSLLWNTGETLASYTVSTAGTYSVTTTVNGCTSAAGSGNANPGTTPVGSISADGPTTFCAGGSVTLTADASNGTYLWSNGATTRSIIVHTPGVYSVYINDNGCTTSSDAIEVIVNNPPQITSPASASDLCVGGATVASVNVVSEAGLSFAWTSSDPSIVSFAMPAIGIYNAHAPGAVVLTVTVTNQITGCVSGSSVTVTINPLPVIAPITGIKTVCVGSTTTLSSTTTGGTWYSSDEAVATVDANGVVTGISDGEAEIYYTVTNENNCSNTEQTTVTVNAVPAAPIVTVTDNCDGTSVLSTNASGVLRWNTGENTSSITVNTEGTYYVNTTVNGCVSQDGSGVAAPKTTPQNTVNASGPTTFCSGGSVLLTADAGTGTYAWSNGATTRTILVTEQGYYSVTITNNGCVAISAPVTVTVNPIVTPVFNQVAAICYGTPLAPLATTSTNGIQGTWSPALNNTATTTYTFTPDEGQCAINTTMTIVVNNNSINLTSGAGTDAQTVCINSPVTYITYATTGATGANFSGLPPGVTGSWSANVVTISGTPGVAGTFDYTVTLTGGCGALPTNGTITVNDKPTITGTLQMCPLGTVTLTGSGTPAVSNAWTSSDPFIATVSQTGVVTAAAGSGGTNITYTDINGCSNTVLVLVNARPDPTSNSNPGTRCGTGTVNLSAFGLANETFDWYDAATGGNLVFTGNGFTTPSISATTTYYVETRNTITGCVSATRTAVTATVTPKPADLTYTVTPNCDGSTTITANNVTGTLLWNYNAETNNSITVYADGVYGATQTLDGCSSNPTSVSVTVFQLPTVFEVSGNAQFCTGSTGSTTAVLSGSETGVVYTLFRDGSPTGLSQAGTGEAISFENLTVVGTYTIQAARTGTPNCTVEMGGSAVLYMFPVPQFTIRSIETEICTGNTGRFDVNVIHFRNSLYRAYTSATGTELADGQWNGPMFTTPVLLTTTTYYIEIEIEGGCLSARVPVTVTVFANPAVPAITGTPAVCVNRTTKLDNAVTGGEWWSDDEGIATVDQDGLVTGISAGQTTIYYMVTEDNNGNATCGATVAVEVTVHALPAPVITAPPVTTICTGSSVLLSEETGYAGYQWQKDGIDIPGATGATYAATATGSYTVTATGAGGCSVTSEPVTVSLQVPPVFTSCPGSFTVDAENCKAYVNYSIGIDDGDPSATVNYTFTGATTGSGGGFGSGSQFNLGVTTVTITAVNPCGTVSCTFTVTVKDVTPPVQPTLDDITAACSVTVTAPETTDGCSGTITGTTSNDLTYTTQGTHIIHWTFTDAGGNQSYADQNVIISDVTPPVPVCPENISLTANTIVSGTGGRYVSYAATATDNCSTPTLSYSPASGHFFTVGTHTVTVTAVDAAGNTATCTFDVTVNNLPIDAVNDDYTSTPINGALGGTTPIVLTNDLLNNTAVSISDINLTLLNNGGITGLSFDAYGALIVPAGTWEGDYTVSYRICEKANPTNCDDATVIIRIARGLKLTAYTYCNNDVPYVHYKVVPNFTPDANPVTITWFNGNMTPVTAQTITTGQPLEGDMLWPGAVLDDNGQPVDWPGWYIENGVWVEGADGFEGTRPTAYVQISVNPAELIEVSYPPATPLCNSAPTNRPPVANPDSKTIEKCGTATIDVVANDTDFEMGALTVTSVSTPAHGTVVINGDGTLTYTPAAGFAGTDNFTYAVVDAAGLTATTTVTITVVDTTAPIVPSLQTIIEECAATVPVPTAADGCGGFVTGVPDKPLSYTEQGEYDITWTFTDASGNTSTATQHVSVKDITKPIPVCPADITVTANTIVSGTSGRYVTYAATATDNCSTPTLSYSRASGDFFAVGTHTITVTAVDAAGNTATCTFDVTVDCVPPVITECPADRIVNTDAGVCSAVVDYTSGFNLGLPTATVSYTFSGATTGSGPGTGTGKAFNKGVTYVTVTASNLCGTVNCTFAITVEDHENPTITAPANVTVNVDANSCVATNVDLGTPVTDDNCEVASLVNDAPPTFAIGTTTVTWRVKDGSGNASIATQTVTVVDNVNPVVNCPLDITLTATHTVGTVTGAYATYNVTASDNCGTATVSYSLPSGSLFAIGSTPVTVTARDAAGNTTTCTFNVIVNCVKPTITCPAPVTVNTANGLCTAPVSYVPTITYGLPAGTVSYVFTGATTGSGPGTGSGATFKKGVTTVTITVSNSCGAASRSFTITVVDNQNPTIVAPSNVTVPANAYCQATGVSLGTPATGDNCGVQSVENNAPSIFPIGSTTVTWTVTDVSGRTSTATQTVTVVDNTAPTISCPSDIVLSANTVVSGVSGANATYTATATDNCGAVTVYYSIAPGSFFPIGTTPVTVTAKDAKGNIATCTFNVVVNCVKPGFTSCPSAVTANTVATGCYAAVSYNVTTAAGMPAATVSYTLSGATTGSGSGTGTGLNFNKGVTTVTVTAANSCGSVSKSFDVTVADKTVPVITSCPANTTAYCGGSTLPAATGTATATDNCGAVTVTYTDVVNGNTITRTWKATDAALNSSTCTQTITTGGIFTATITSLPTSNTFTGGAANSLFIGYGAQSTKLQVNVPSTGGPYTYTWSGSAVTMLNSTTTGNPVFTPTAGNSYTFTVVVKNVYGCTSTATITICVTDIRVMSSNDDDDDEQTTCDHRSHDYSDCSHRGHNHSCNHRTHSKYDCSHRHNGDDDDDRHCDHQSHSSSECAHRGHNHNSCDHRSHSSSSCNHNKRTYGSSQKVCDHKSHSSRDCNHNSHHHNSCNHGSHNSNSCPHNGTGQDDPQKVYICHVPPGNTNNPLTLSISINAVADHLANHPGDRLGSCAQQPCSPFVDTEKPDIDCPAGITVNYGSSTVPSATGSATASDNSNVVTITYTDASNKSTNAASTGFYNYTITRTWKATDAAGNFATCAQTITVKDVTKPVISCPGAITVTCSNLTGTANTGLATATDNSGGPIAITYSDSKSGTTTTRTWKATDVCGNYATCTQTIRVVDNIKPVISCPANTTVSCGASTAPSNCGNGASATATDNCDNKVSISYSDNKSGNVITRTWKATDASGNFSTCTQTITVIDNVKPVISCPGNITVSCGSNTTPKGCNSEATAKDNCDNNVDITYSDITAGNVITRTWRAQDDAGNYSTCVQKITIVDNVKPVLTEPNDITVSCASLATPASTGTATATDNCSAVTITYTDATSGNKITRTWKATDASGNFSTDVQIITINDNVKPVLTDPNDITINCGTSTAPSATGMATATDNCSNVTITYSDVTSGNKITRTWKATDASGNYVTGVQVITIVDNTKPTINVPSNVTISCSASTAPSSCGGSATGTDNCSTVSISYSDVRNGNVITRTWKATDASGNFNTGVQTITLIDNVKPVISCPGNITVSCGSNTTPKGCNSEATAKDNCDNNVDITYSDITAGNVITRTWIATDDAGNTSSCVQKITIVDNVKPVLTEPNDITVSCASLATPASTGTATATDNCSAVTITYTDATSGNKITRTWKATDASGNFSTDVQIITINDNVKPVLTDPNDITINCGTSTAPSATGMATATDNCSNVTITYSDVTSGNKITRTWKATDASGNYVTGVQVITIVDNTKPTINVPSNVTISCSASTAPSSCGGSATGTDNCSTVSISYSDVRNGNVITRTWKATDASGNFNTGVQTITLIDNVKPVISCPGNITVSCGSNTTPAGCNSIATATDNCDNSVDITFSDVTSGNVITRTWRAQDDAGNYSTCVQKITIVDNVKPVLTEPNDITVSCASSTHPSVTGNATATDNCSAVTITYTDATSGNKITRTWRATDASGNYSTDVQIITISDNTKPAITDVPDVTLNCGGSTAPAATGTASATDNCSTPTVTYSDATNGNVITRTWKATDAAGNFSTSTQVITVGASFSPNITSVPTASTYTGGIATNLYIGYGAQSTRLEVCALPSAGAPYTYTWSGSATSRLSSTTNSAPVFTPATYGSFTFTVSVKNKFGCTYTGYITICVTDIRVGTNGSKVYVCNTVRDKYGRATKQTLQVAVNQVSSYINNSSCDNDEARLGSCDQTPCNYTGVTASSGSGTKQGITAEGDQTVKMATTEEVLKVTVMPNPSTTFFTLKLESKYETPVNMRVMDAGGRVVDARTKLGVNSTLQIGHNYSSGTYYAELIQGGTRKVVQLIKARG